MSVQELDQTVQAHSLVELRDLLNALSARLEALEDQADLAESRAAVSAYERDPSGAIPWVNLKKQLHALHPQRSSSRRRIPA